jgi:PIN domain
VSEKAIDSRVPLSIIRGYTVLDISILLSNLSMISSLIESFRWTIIILLPVIMELDDLSVNTSQLGRAPKNIEDLVPRLRFGRLIIGLIGQAEPVAVTNAVKVFLLSLDRIACGFFFFVLIASKKLTKIFFW